MLSLALRRIQNSSANAVDHLRNKVKTLKISALKDEDVDHAVSLVKSAHQVLLSASTPSHNYVPLHRSQGLRNLLQCCVHESVY